MSLRYEKFGELNCATHLELRTFPWVMLEHFVIYFKCFCVLYFESHWIIVNTRYAFVPLVNAGVDSWPEVEVKLHSRKSKCFIKRKMVSKRLQLMTLTLNSLSESVSRSVLIEIELWIKQLISHYMQEFVNFWNYS